MNEKKSKQSNIVITILSVVVVILVIGMISIVFYQNSVIKELDSKLITASENTKANTIELTTEKSTETPTTEPMTEVKSRTKLFEKVLKGNTFNNYDYDDEYNIKLYFDKRGGVTYTNLIGSYYCPYIVDDDVLTVYNSELGDYSYTITYSSGVGAHGAYYNITLKSQKKDAPFNGEWFGEVVS